MSTRQTPPSPGNTLLPPLASATSKSVQPTEGSLKESTGSSVYPTLAKSHTPSRAKAATTEKSASVPQPKAVAASHVKDTMNPFNSQSQPWHATDAVPPPSRTSTAKPKASAIDDAKQTNQSSNARSKVRESYIWSTDPTVKSVNPQRPVISQVGSPGGPTHTTSFDTGNDDSAAPMMGPTRSLTRHSDFDRQSIHESHHSQPQLPSHDLQRTVTASNHDSHHSQPQLPSHDLQRTVTASNHDSHHSQPRLPSHDLQGTVTASFVPHKLSLSTLSVHHDSAMVAETTHHPAIESDANLETGHGEGPTSSKVNSRVKSGSTFRNQDSDPKPSSGDAEVESRTSHPIQHESVATGDSAVIQQISWASSRKASAVVDTTSINRRPTTENDNDGPSMSSAIYLPGARQTNTGYTSSTDPESYIRESGIDDHTRATRTEAVLGSSSNSRRNPITLPNGGVVTPGGQAVSLSGTRLSVLTDDAGFVLGSRTYSPTMESSPHSWATRTRMTKSVHSNLGDLIMSAFASGAPENTGSLHNISTAGVAITALTRESSESVAKPSSVLNSAGNTVSSSQTMNTSSPASPLAGNGSELTALGWKAYAILALVTVGVSTAMSVLLF